MRPPPATPFETIGPRDDLELYAAYHSAVLELRVPQSTSFPMKGYLSPDVEPFLLNTAIGRRQLSQLGQSMQGFCISTLGHKPTGPASTHGQRLVLQTASISPLRALTRMEGTRSLSQAQNRERVEAGMVVARPILQPYTYAHIGVSIASSK